MVRLIAGCGGDPPAASPSPAVESKTVELPAVESKSDAASASKAKAEREPSAPTPPDCTACTDGECRPIDAEACHERSENYRYARGVKLDLAKHGDFAQLACDAGYFPDCSVLAMLYQDGIGGRQHSDPKAYELHERSCEGGAGIGCFNLASMVEAGGAGPADPERAQQLYTKSLALLERSCEGGDVQWCANVGYMYGAGHGVAQDQRKAVAAYERGCPQHEYNCVNLALVLLDGRGGEPDIPRGTKLLEDGCKDGGSRSCAHLGTALLMGREGVPADAPRAVEVLTRACDGGQSLGCIGMAAAHGMGVGVAADPDRAIDFSERACALGDSSACAGAIRELLSRPIKPEPSQVRGLLDAACKIGSAVHCGFLAIMVRDGIGGGADAGRASELFAEGCRRGDLDSCAAVVTAGGEPDVRPAERPKLYDALCTRGVAPACKAAEAAIEP